MFTLGLERSSKSRLIEPEADVGVQADRGMSPGERRFTEEYVERVNELRALLSEEQSLTEQMRRELIRERDEKRALQADLQRAVQNARPPNPVA